MKKGYIGTYSSNGSKGIYQFLMEENSGLLYEASLFTEIQNSKYISLSDTHLYSVYDDENGSGVAVYSQDGVLLDKCIYERSTSCFFTVTGEEIYTANYHLGTVTKLSFDGKLTVESTYLIKEKAGCHQVIVYNDKVFVPCLYLDTIYVFDKNLNKLNEIPFPSGSGCRHGALSEDEKYLYVVGELSNKLYVLNLSTYEIENEISILPDGMDKCEGSAAIRLSKDGKKIFVSTREINIITVVEVEGIMLEIETIFSVEGDHPRDIMNVMDDQYLVVANRFSNELCSFDMKNGYRLINKIQIPDGVSIAMEGER